MANPSIPRMLWRAARRRCPNCGSAGIFNSWFRMKPACPTCGLALERGEQGYLVGSYMFNIVAAELCFAAIFVAALLLTWPTPPWRVLQYGGAALMILAPIAFWPYSRTFFLAFDLIFRPVVPGDPGAHR